MAIIVNERTSFQAQIEHREWREHKQTQIAYAYDWFGFAVPFLAPMVPASLTFAAIYANYPALLEIPSWAGFVIGLIAAAAIEALGVLSIETFFDMRQYNATIKDGEGRAPEGWAGLIVAIYLIVVLWLVVVLKMNHNLVIWSLIPLAVLGFISSAIMVMRKQHNDKEFGRKMVGQSILDKVRGELAKAQETIRDLTAQISQMKNQIAHLLASQETAKNDLSAMANRAILAEELAESMRLENGQLAIRIGLLEHDLAVAQSAKIRPNTPKRKAKIKMTKSEILADLPSQRAGNSQQALADMYGVSKGTIQNYLDELGLN